VSDPSDFRTTTFGHQQANIHDLYWEMSMPYHTLPPLPLLLAHMNPRMAGVTSDTSLVKSNNRQFAPAQQVSA
jgi:hypothetical protein